MGRSVDYPCDAEWTVFMTFEYEAPEWAYDEWEDFREDITCALETAFPASHRPGQEVWDGRNCQAILGNGHGHFYLSEYCGMVSLSFKQDGDETTGLGEHWAQQALVKVRKVFAGSLLYKTGTMSNGEGVYERIPA